MAAPDDAPNVSKTVCWQCGRAADPNAAYTATLVTSPKRALSPLGFPVKRLRRWDSVRVPIPRCRTCRARNRVSVVIVLLGAAFGAAVVPSLWSKFGPSLAPPSWVQIGGRTEGDPTIGVGIVLGFVVALVGVTLRKRQLGLRSLNTYPPIAALRSRGWAWPND
jgi:hypothetical protein